MSRVYEEIVSKNINKSHADIKYLIAYSIYKKQKKEYIENYKIEHGKKPKTEKLNEFQSSVLTETSLNNLYSNTSEILTTYGDAVFKSKLEQLSNINSIVNGKKQFWTGVRQSILGSFIFALLIFIIGLIINFTKEGGLKEVLRGLLE